MKKSVTQRFKEAGLTVADARNFIKRAKATMPKGKYEDFMEKYSEQPLDTLIASTFIWSETPEGFDYWSDLREKARRTRYNQLLRRP